jgi:hypothetical protein
MTSWGWPVSIKYLKSLTVGFLQAKGDNEPLGQHWYKNFLSRTLVTSITSGDPGARSILNSEVCPFVGVLGKRAKKKENHQITCWLGFQA